MKGRKTGIVQPGEKDEEKEDEKTEEGQKEKTSDKFKCTGYLSKLENQEENGTGTMPSSQGVGSKVESTMYEVRTPTEQNQVSC